MPIQKDKKSLTDKAAAPKAPSRAGADASREDVQQGLRETGVAGKAKPAPAAPAKAVPQAAAPGGTKHKVVAGDTLSAISLKYYKTANRWKEIYEANKAVIGADPNKIKAGQELVIPNAGRK